LNAFGFELFKGFADVRHFDGASGGAAATQRMIVVWETTTSRSAIIAARSR
jgi:hypothetical protein